MQQKQPLAALAAVLTIVTMPASYAATVATTPSTENGPNTGSYSPSFTTTTDLIDGSASDLLAGLTATSSSGNFTLESSPGLGVLTDGRFQDIGISGPGQPHDAFATAGGGNGSGTVVTYNLDLTGATLGYDISRINVYGGWNDGGRDQQHYTVAFAPVSDLTNFTDVLTVDFNSTGNQVANVTGIEDDGGGNIGTGVGAIRFTFNTVENGYTGYAELDAIGVATVPEPSSIALLGLGGLAFILHRRK